MENGSSKADLDNLIATDILPQNDNWDGTEEFLRSIVAVLLKYIREVNDHESKILEFHHPAEMMRLVDLSIPDAPENLSTLVEGLKDAYENAGIRKSLQEELEEKKDHPEQNHLLIGANIQTSCEKVLKYGVRTGHPRFFNQISCGLDIVSMAGEWLTATANTNMFTYEIAPVFILMEKEVMKKMWEAIGWDIEKADGIFAPGGAIANLYALNAARHHLFPRAKHLGAKDVPILCAFTSEDSHYSIKSAAAVCGIGTDYCFNIPTDAFGKMIPEALERKIIECKKDGMAPLFVCCTAGTTVYGAFDPIERIADICEKHRIWLHVDAAWGGGLLLSSDHRYRLSGIERADSVTWNPHKLMGAILQCSACLFKRDGLLFQCNQMSADYLFMQDKPYDVSFDTGDKAIQCGRHNDVFKLWLMWKSKGVEGYRQQINRLMDLCQYFTQRIKDTEGYELVLDQPEFLNICFWYVPRSIRNLETAERKARLEKIAPKIKAKMMERGTTMVGYQPDKNLPNFFRMIISNQAITKADLDFLINEIVEIGESL